MRKSAFVGAVASVAFAATAAVAATKSFDASGFTRVSTTAGTDVEINIGSDFSVTAEGDQKALDRLDIRVDGNMLVIRRKTGLNFLQKSGSATVKVSAPVLAAVLATAGSDVQATSVDAAEFRLKASSGAQISASGQCIGLSIEASSGGAVNASSLECEMATAEARSGGSVDVFTSKSIVAEASSGGQINVHGGPEAVEIEKSSGGDVKILNKD